MKECTTMDQKTLNLTKKSGTEVKSDRAQVWLKCNCGSGSLDLTHQVSLICTMAYMIHFLSDDVIMAREYRNIKSNQNSWDQGGVRTSLI